MGANTDSRFSGSRVLVTGGAGYIGSHAVLALLDAGWRVAVLDNLVTGFRWAVPAEAVFYEGDVADPVLVARLIAEQQIGAILHFAGSVVVPESVADPLKYYRNNTAASRSLIDSAVTGGVRHMIFSSTAATYGIPDVVPVTEAAAQRPINPYGMSKLMTEAMLADVAAAHDFNYCALRYFNVAGADRDGLLGEDHRPETHLIPAVLQAPLGRREGLAGTCVANADNLVTIPKAWLESRIGALAHDKTAALEQALRYALELP
jgi:UDP-glucose 4-epimerase